MSIRLIATDLDGTLLDENGKASSLTRQVLLHAQHSGIRLVLATGRSLAGFSKIREVLQTDNFAGNYYIALNGGIIYSCATRHQICAPGIPHKTANQLLQLGASLDLHVLCYTSEYRFSYMPAGFVQRRLQYLHDHHLAPEPDFAELQGSSILLQAPNLPVNLAAYAKIALLHSSHRLQEVLPTIRAFCGQNYSAMMVSSNWLEIIPTSVSKGSALQHIMHLCDIHQDEVAAFGDAENDIDMLKNVAHGYTMRNALPELISQSHLIAPANTEDGVAQIVCKLCGYTEFSFF